jgi:hypothetical protein
MPPGFFEAARRVRPLVVSWFVASVSGRITLFIVGADMLHCVTDGRVENVTPDGLGRFRDERVYAVSVTRDPFRFAHDIAHAAIGDEGRTFWTEGDRVCAWLRGRADVRHDMWPQSRFVRAVCECVRSPAAFLRGADGAVAADIVLGRVGAALKTPVVVKHLQAFWQAGSARYCEGLVSDYIAFTMFVQHLTAFLDEAADRAGEKLQARLAQLFHFLPFRREEILRPAIEIIARVIVEEPWAASNRDHSLELLAVALGPKCLEQVGIAAPVDPGKLQIYSQGLPSLKFGIGEVRRITPRDAIMKFIRAAWRMADRVARVESAMDKPTRLTFQDSFKQFVAQAGLTAMQIVP